MLDKELERVVFENGALAMKIAIAERLAECGLKESAIVALDVSVEAALRANRTHTEGRFLDASARELAEDHGTLEIDEENAAQDECDRARE